MIFYFSSSLNSKLLNNCAFILNYIVQICMKKVFNYIFYLILTNFFWIDSKATKLPVTKIPEDKPR